MGFFSIFQHLGPLEIPLSCSVQDHFFARSCGAGECIQHSFRRSLKAGAALALIPCEIYVMYVHAVCFMRANGKYTLVWPLIFPENSLDLANWMSPTLLYVILQHENRRGKHLKSTMLGIKIEVKD